MSNVQRRHLSGASDRTTQQNMLRTTSGPDNPILQRPTCVYIFHGSLSTSEKSSMTLDCLSCLSLQICMVEAWRHSDKLSRIIVPLVQEQEQLCVNTSTVRGREHCPRQNTLDWNHSTPLSDLRLECDVSLCTPNGLTHGGLDRRKIVLGPCWKVESRRWGWGQTSVVDAVYSTYW